MAPRALAFVSLATGLILDGRVKYKMINDLAVLCPLVHVELGMLECLVTFIWSVDYGMVIWNEVT